MEITFMMLRLVLLCMCSTVPTWAQSSSSWSNNKGSSRRGSFGGFRGGSIRRMGGGIGKIRGVTPVVGQSQSCRRWCRTPQGQAYCCESGNEPVQAVFTIPGRCPPVRPSCPPTEGSTSPKQCSNDGGCGGVDKCCFDTCLQHHTCKPPQGFGRSVQIRRVSPVVGRRQSCRRWCRTPQGQAYCCRSRNAPI